MKMRRSKKDTFIGIRINKSVNKLIEQGGENKSEFIRTAIERYLIALADLDTAV